MAGLIAAFDPERFAEWLGHGLSSEMLGRILAVPRLEAACTRLVERRIGPLTGHEHPAGAVVGGMDGLALLWLAQRAGAVWHACAILRVIDGAAVRALVKQIGPVLRDVAIRHAGLAAGIAAGRQDGEELADPAELAGRIASDGLGCVAAWCDAQPPALGRRVLLAMPCAARADARHRAHGPAIVDALLETAP